MQDVNRKCQTKWQSIVYVLAMTKVVTFGVFLCKMLERIANVHGNMSSSMESINLHETCSVSELGRGVQVHHLDLSEIDMSCPSASIQTQKQSNPAKHFALAVSASGPLEKKTKMAATNTSLHANSCFVICPINCVLSPETYDQMRNPTVQLIHIYHSKMFVGTATQTNHVGSRCHDEHQ